MKICISEQSISDFVKFFKNNVRGLDVKGLSKDQVYKAMYNNALSKSEDPTDQASKDMVLQHMLFLPIALNGMIDSINPEVALDLGKTLEAMNDSSKVSSLIEDYQKIITDTIDLEEEEITPEESLDDLDVNFFTAMHFDVLTNQAGEYQGKTIKLDPNRKNAFSFLRRVLSDVLDSGVNHKVLALKLGKLKELAQKNNFQIDQALIETVYSPEALVFVVADEQGNILLSENKTAVPFNTITAREEDLYENFIYSKDRKEMPFKHERLKKMHGALTENILNKEGNTLTEEEASLKAKESLIHSINSLLKIKKSVNANENKQFLLDIDPASSNFGYIKHNSKQKTQVKDIKEIEKFSLEVTVQKNKSGRPFKFYTLSGHSLHDTPVFLEPNSLDSKPELVNNLVELLTNNELTLDGKKLNPTQRRNLFKQYVNVQSDTRIKFKADGVVSIDAKSFSENDPGLKQALLDFFNNYSVSKRIKKANVIESNVVTDLKEANENSIFKTTSGEYYSVSKPKFSFAVKVKNKVEINDGVVTLVPTTQDQHVLENAYTRAEVSVDNELRVYHARIGFAYTESPAEVVVNENNDNDIVINDDHEDLFATNAIELKTVSEQSEQLALDWFTGSPLAKKLDLKISDKKHPHALAQWFSSGITLYNGSNNTLIYHEAWHAFTQGILTKEEKDKLYTEVKKNYPKEQFDSLKDVEEFLAEKFRDYAINNVKPKGSKLKQFFENILNSLKSLFLNRNLTEKYFADLVEGKIDMSTYNPREKMYWGTLNANITSFNSEEIDNLSAAESKLILDTLDALVSEKYSEIIKTKSFKISKAEDLKPLYKHAYIRFQKIKDELVVEAERLNAIKDKKASDKMDIANNAVHLKAVTFTLAEFGNLDDILNNINETGSNKGVIGGHLTRGSFISESALLQLEQEEEKNENDPFKERKDVSLEEYADSEILQLLTTIPEFNEKGEPVLNGLGVQVLANKVKVLTKIGKLTMSLASEEAIFEALRNSKDKTINEVLQRLPLNVATGEPVYSFGSQLLWSKFFQTFNKSNLPLKQLLFQRVNDGKTVDVQVKHGVVSGSTTQVERDWNSSFESTPFVKKDIHGAYLDVDAAIDWIEANPNATPAEKLNAIGISITNNDAVNKALLEGDSLSNVPGGMLDYFIDRLESDISIYTTDFNKRINSLQDLIKDYDEYRPDPTGVLYPSPKKGLRSYFNNLKVVEFKHSDNYNSFMGTNAEGETASELVLNSSVTNMLNYINSVETLDELLENPAFEFLNPETNPFQKANNWMKQLFDEKGNKIKTSSGNVSIVNENFSGTKFFEQFTDDRDFISVVERGLSNMGLDANSKFVTDVYLSYFNKSEAPRMADKSSSFHFGLKGGKQVFNAENINDKTLMYDAMEGYLIAEIVRINTMKTAEGNIDKKYRDRGQDFFIFDDLLSNNTKELVSKTESVDYNEVLNEVRKHKSDVTSDLDKYFQTKIDKTINQKASDFYVPNTMLKTLDVKNKIEASRILISMYEKNKFLYNVDFTTMFLGDPAVYNVEKGDFHKRIAGIISTGETFRADKWMLNYFNHSANKSRSYSASKGNKDFRTYDGTINVAVTQDHEVSSEYLKEIKEALNKEGLKDQTGPYQSMNEADGQGFVSFDFYRMLSMSQGTWSPVKETMYNKIVKGESYDQTKVSEFFQSMKLQYYGPVNSDSLIGTAFHKFNLIPLIPTVIKGTKLEELHNKMMEQEIDYMTFESGSKLSTISSTENEGNSDPYYNENRDLNNDIQFTKNVTNVKYLKNQIKIHNEFKGKVTLPTQMRTILYAGLMDKGIPTDVNLKYDNWNALSDEEKALKSDNYKWVLKYESALKDIAEFKRTELFNELGITEEADISKSSEKLSKMVRSELTRSEIDEAQIDYLFENDSLKTDISLSINASQVEKIIVALISKRMTKIKVKGEGLIQMASTMTEKQDSQWKKATDEERLKYGTNGLRSYHLSNGKIKSMEVKIALQGDFEKLLYIKGKDGKSIATYSNLVRNGEVVLKNDKPVKELDYDATLAKLNELMSDEVWKEENKSLFTLTTSRIPGQAMNSLEFMEVKEFLPKQAGNVIIVPSEMVAKSGSDFDVDKLFTMMPNLAVYNGQAEVIKKTKTEDVSELRKELNESRKALKEARDSFFEKLDLNSDVYAEVSNIDSIKEDIQTYREISKSYDWDNSSQTEREEKIQLDLEIKAMSFKLSEIYDALNVSKALKNELNKLTDVVSDLERRIAGQSIKGLENNLIDVIVERLEREDNFVDLVRPNDTNLVDYLADDLEENVSVFDSYERVHSKEKLIKGKKAISKTIIFDPNFNINKQIENAVGMDTLGIGAVINKYYSLFTRIGMYTNIDSNELSYDDYVKLDAKVKNKKKLTFAEQNAYDDYKNYKLHFPKHNTKTVNGKVVTDLSSLYNQAGEYIPDVLGQMINGWVDVAKGGWIFNIQGNKEATPTLLYLFMAGVPVEDAVYFASSPIIRDYLEEKRKQNGALSVLNNPETYNAKNKDVLEKLSDIDAYKRVVSSLNIDLKVKNKLTSDFMKNTSQLVKMNVINNKAIDMSLVKDYVEKNNTSRITDVEKLDLLNKFVIYENISAQITSLTTSTTFDTKAESTLSEVRKNIDNFELLNDNKALPVNIKDLILKHSAVGPFESAKMVQKLFSNFAPLKNNSGLIRKAEQGIFESLDLGIRPEQHVELYQNDFIWYLYQNEHNRINDNTYAGVTLIADNSVDLYELNNNVLTYNPELVNGLVSGLGRTLGTLRHRFDSSNAALQFLTHYALNDNTDLPKDSIHYILAKKAISDEAGISKDTLEEMALSSEDYEELIQISAIESKALIASGNRPSMMNGPFSYADRMLVLAEQNPELKGKLSLLKDLRHNYSKYSKNLYLANVKDTGYSKIYREDLEILKEFPNMEIQELFSQFDRFATLQSGNRTSGKFNMTSVIDPFYIQNTIGEQYEDVNKYMSKLSSHNITSYSVLDVYNEMYYGEGNYQQLLWSRNRGGSFESDMYFDLEIGSMEETLDLSLFPQVSKLDGVRSINSNKALIYPSESLEEVSSIQHAELKDSFPTLLNQEVVEGDVIYLTGSEDVSNKKVLETEFKLYKSYIDNAISKKDVEFNISGKPGIETMAMDYLEKLGYKKHPMSSKEGLYYVMSKDLSKSISGFYNTMETTLLDEKSKLNSTFVSSSVKASIDQLAAYQIASKINKLDEYNKAKSNSKTNWRNFIESVTSNDLYIEASYKYVVEKMIQKDSGFKESLIETNDSALIQSPGSNKINNFYVRALLRERAKLVTINRFQQKEQDSTSGDKYNNDKYNNDKLGC